jgi:glycosyltransferase involved in cell wall biosynthesis
MTLPPTRGWLRPVAQQARRLGAHARGIRAALSGRAPRRTVAVWYGQRIPPRDAIEVGGILKLQHLDAAMPNHPNHFNVLYLVSSRLPDGVDALAFWARKKGARIVLNQNGVAYPAWYKGDWRAINAPMRTLLGDADHVFYQSGFCKLSADRFAGPAGGGNEVLHNAVDTGAFHPADGPRRTPLTLLLGGSQDQWYRVESAVRGFRMVRDAGLDARLLITGRLRWHAEPARSRHELESLLMELKVADRVELVGPYTQEQAPAIFRRADLLVHTKYNDPCPAVVIEAMASGLPVVYSASGGVPELVGADAGIGIPAPLSWEHDVAPDPAAVAQAVIAASHDLDERSRAARQRAVTHFDVTPWVARHRDVFERLIAA